MKNLKSMLILIILCAIGLLSIGGMFAVSHLYSEINRLESTLKAQEDLIDNGQFYVVRRNTLESSETPFPVYNLKGQCTGIIMSEGTIITGSQE
jgi:hypothetical protein